MPFQNNPQHFLLLLFCSALTRPEAYGVISGAVFLIITFLFIPLRFYETLVFDKELSQSQVIIALQIGGRKNKM